MRLDQATLELVSEGQAMAPSPAILLDQVPELVAMAMRACRQDDRTAESLAEVDHSELAADYSHRAERLRAVASQLTDDLPALQAALDTVLQVQRRAGRAAALILLHADGVFPLREREPLSRSSKARG